MSRLPSLGRPLIAASLFLFTVPVGAAEPTTPPAWALLRQAQAAESAADPKGALELYRSILTIDPDGSSERVARARIGWLEARSAEDYPPLSRLMKLQISSKGALTRELVAAFERDTEAAPMGLVRQQSWALLGWAWLDVLNDPVSAERTYRAWLRDPMEDQGTRQTATTGLARARMRQGHALEALSIMREAGLQGVDEYQQLQAMLVKKVGDPIAWACVFLFGLIAAACVVPRMSRAHVQASLPPGDVLLLPYLLGVPCVLATRYQASNAPKFERLGLSLGAVVIASLLAGGALRLRGDTPVLRTAVAISAALACLAVGFISFDQSELLEGLLRWYGA